MEPWTQLKRDVLVDDRWLTLYADRCKLPNGHTIEPFYVVEEKEWVHIVAINEDGLILLTKQYRYAAGITSTELPGGAVEDGEAPLTASKRELKEETGFEANNWTRLAITFANPARQTNRIHCYLAIDLNDTDDRSLDISEEIICWFSSISDVKKMIQTGEFAQSLHIASLLLAVEHLKESKPPEQTKP